MHDAEENTRPESDSLTWVGLLARWVAVAKASVTLPSQGDAGRWKRSLPALIELQATVLALRDLAAIPERDRPLARDLAAVLVRRASGELARIWGDVPMPSDLVEIQHDATVALREALYAGLVEVVWTGPGVLEVPEVEIGAGHGTLAIMPPGSLAMPGEPVAWFAEREPIVILGCVARPAPGPRQVYRELDDRGMFVRDLVARLEGDLPAGLPMLVPMSLGGSAIGRFLYAHDEWLAMQRAAMVESTAADGTIPVVVEE